MLQVSKRAIGIALIGFAASSCGKKSSNSKEGGHDDHPPVQQPDPRPNQNGEGGGGAQTPADGFNLNVDPNAESVQKDLVDKFCVRCHSGERPAYGLDLTNVAKYSDGSVPPGYQGKLIVPGKPLESMLYVVMSSTDAAVQMPPSTSGLPHVKPEQYKSVETWIAKLTPQQTGNQPGPGGGSETPQGDFNRTVQPTAESVQRDLVNEFCVRCHSGEHPAHGLDLTNVAKYSDGSIPPGYHTKLIVPGRAVDSMLYLVMKSTNARDQMPPARSGLPHVKPDQYKAVEQWINSLPRRDGDDEAGPGNGDGDDEPGAGGGDHDSDEPGAPSPGHPHRS